jgi:tripartite-type tricarboxylate transporter receptor subunit TctC
MKIPSLFFVPLLLWSFAVSAQDEPYYKDKTIKIIVGFTPTGAVDLWARHFAQHMSNHLAGRPDFIVQNVAGAGSMIAANQLFNVVKPDGQTLGMVSTSLYFDQLVGRKEVQFDWSKFAWIGSPTRNEELLYVRTDSPYKSLDDIRKASQPPRCGATGAGTTSHYFPRFLEDALGLKFNIVLGYPGTREIELAAEKGEVHCIGATMEIIKREPSRTWLKKGLIRILVQGGSRRDPMLPNVPTIYELMEQHKTPADLRRFATVLLSPGDFGRPMVGPPGLPGNLVKILREGYRKTVTSEEFLSDARKRDSDVEYTSGEDLEALAKKVIAQPPEVVERLKKILGE